MKRGSKWERGWQEQRMQSAEGRTLLNSCRGKKNKNKNNVHILYIVMEGNLPDCMPLCLCNGNSKQPFDLWSLLQLCLKHLHVSQPCWSTQWHPVPLTPTSVPIPSPWALWLAALYPDRYTALGCPTGLRGNEIQMPQYLRYHCSKPLL